MDDFFVGDVIAVTWHERDSVPEIGIYSGVERGFCLLTTKEGKVIPFLINNVTINKLDRFPDEPLPLDTFLLGVKENKNICILFFVIGTISGIISSLVFKTVLF